MYIRIFLCVFGRILYVTYHKSLGCHAGSLGNFLFTKIQDARQPLYILRKKSIVTRVYMHFSTLLINKLPNIVNVFLKKIQFPVQWDVNRAATIFLGDTAAFCMTNPPKVKVTKLSQLRKTKLLLHEFICIFYHIDQ